MMSFEPGDDVYFYGSGMASSARTYRGTIDKIDGDYALVKLGDAEPVRVRLSRLKRR